MEAAGVGKNLKVDAYFHKNKVSCFSEKTLRRAFLFDMHHLKVLEQHGGGVGGRLILEPFLLVGDSKA